MESYSLERQPIFRDVGEDIIGGWIRDDRKVLESCSPDRDREKFARRFEEVAKGFGKRLRGFEPHDEGSPVVAGPSVGADNTYGEHLFAARAGHHLAPQSLTSGRSVFDALGDGCRLVLVRPDQFVAWTGDHAPPDVGALLDRVAGRG